MGFVQSTRGNCSRTASGYFCAAPVLKITMRSVGLILPSLSSTSNAPRHTAVSGHKAMPSREDASCIHLGMSASGVASATPPLPRTASRIMKSPTAAGTRMPLAMVAAFSNFLAKRSFFLNASAMGAQPVLWQEIMRGFLDDLSQPSASSSAKAFHMPIKPVPPPVG